MKIITFIFLNLCLVGCDPYGFGYKNNPANVLSEALKALNLQDVDSFLEISGKEALCIYGNSVGLAYLKEKLFIDTENTETEPIFCLNRDSNLHIMLDTGLITRNAIW